MINRTPIKTRSAAAARVTQSTELDGATNTPIRCKACAEPNTTRAIRCFECEDEYHVECVEVTERGVQDWRCSACLGKQGDKLKQTTSVPISEPFVSSTNPSSQTMQTTVTSLDTYSNPVQNMSAPSTLLISPGSLFPPLPPHSLLPPHSVIPPNSFAPPCYSIPSYQPAQYQYAMPIPPSRQSNMHVSFASGKNYEQCNTVQSSFGQLIPSVFKAVPSTSNN